MKKSKKSPNAWKDLLSSRTRKKSDRDWPKGNWMDREKQQLSRVKKSKRK